MNFNYNKIKFWFHGVIVSVQTSIAFAITPIFVASIATTVNAQASEITDRIVVMVNSLPYSQLQVERYINVKEALRDDAIRSQIVQSSNWEMALTEFIKEMAIHQEAAKSSGFRPTKDAVEKLRLRVDATAKTAPQFKPAFDRLGLAKEELEIQILKILTVENYRRGKSSLTKTEAKQSTAGQPAWETELKAHAIVRYFDDARTYVPIIFKP
jgi:hypothetical protein